MSEAQPEPLFPLGHDVMKPALHGERSELRASYMEHSVSGYLYKQGSMRKNWKRRFFVIDYPMEDDDTGDSVAAAENGRKKSWRRLDPRRRSQGDNALVERRLLYFSSPGGEFKGEFVLDNASVRVDDELGRPHAFSLVTGKRVLPASLEQVGQEKWCANWTTTIGKKN